jgi:transposase
MTTTIVATPTVTIGVDTHKDFHVAAAIDDRGGVLATATFPADADGYEALRCWAEDLGDVAAYGIEGTSSWGAGLSRHLAAGAVRIVEVNSTNRQHRRRHGKSDTADALAAARAVHSGEANAIPKSGAGAVEAVRVVRLTMRSAIKARTQAMNQLRAVLDTGPAPLRAELATLRARQLVKRAAGLEPVGELIDPHVATVTALVSLARRHQQLDAEITTLRRHLKRLIAVAAPPELLADKGVGPDTAAALVIAAGDNPERMHTDAAFASLCGVSPVDASSGKQQRHRLNRGGNRDANQALWRIVLVKMKHDPQTRAFIATRIERGKTKPEAIRILKRHLARRYWKILTTTPTTPTLTT